MPRVVPPRTNSQVTTAGRVPCGLIFVCNGRTFGRAVSKLFNQVGLSCIYLTIDKVVRTTEPYENCLIWYHQEGCQKVKEISPDDYYNALRPTLASSKFVFTTTTAVQAWNVIDSRFNRMSKLFVNGDHHTFLCYPHDSSINAPTPALGFKIYTNVGMREGAIFQSTSHFHVKETTTGGTVAKFENTAGTVFLELNTNNQPGADAGYIAYDSNQDLSFWPSDSKAVTMTQEGYVLTPNQPLAVTYYNSNIQHGAYAAGSNRNQTTCKPGAYRQDIGNLYSTSTGRYTITQPGVYRAGFNGSNYNNNISNYYYVFIRLNGTVYSYSYQTKDSAITWAHLSGETYLTCADGDYIDFYQNHDSSGTDKGGFDVNQYTTFYVELVR